MFVMPSSRSVLWQIKTLHTLAWALLAASILAIPAVTLRGALDWACWLSVVVWAEVLILCLNGMRCPLRGIAARYTEDRSDGFDIFLPAWLARNNKLIFGSLFAAAELLLLYCWLKR